MDKSENMDKPWPDTPLSNALMEHFEQNYGVTMEEACEAAGEILDIIEKHE